MENWTITNYELIYNMSKGNSSESTFAIEPLNAQVSVLNHMNYLQLIDQAMLLVFVSMKYLSVG